MGCSVLCLSGRFFQIVHNICAWMGCVIYDLLHNVETVFCYVICLHHLEILNQI